MDEHGDLKTVGQSAFDALLDDHRALAEACYGMLGRISKLEARVDYLERGRAIAQELVERTGGSPMPVATEIGLSHIGRALWVVDGETGLWCRKRDHEDERPRSVLARAPDRRGRPRSTFLYRLDALSARMAPVLRKCVGDIAARRMEGTTDGE